MNVLSEVKFFVVHCAATKTEQDITKDDLYRWHVTDNGWSDIGYHYFVKFNGSFSACRDIGYQGAHCKAVNDKSIAICLEGGYGGINNFTQEQLNSLQHLIKLLKVSYPNAAIVGHSHFDNKACPSFDVVNWWENVK